jgi:photosystem II Psb27 protein
MRTTALILACTIQISIGRGAAETKHERELNNENLVALLLLANNPLTHSPRGNVQAKKPIGFSRRSAIHSLPAAATFFASGAAFADDETAVVAPEKPVEPPKPVEPEKPKEPPPKVKPDSEYRLLRDYRQDAPRMLANMQIASELKRGNPDFEKIVVKTREQMIDFLAFYRARNTVTSTPSFSTLYTAINTLAGHYVSYGNKYPVPEKRRVRLQEQYKEIGRALARNK